MDEIIIHKCDALYRVPGESSGADREVELARKLRIPVFTNAEALSDWLIAHSGDEASSQELPDNTRDNGPHPQAYFTPGGKL